MSPLDGTRVPGNFGGLQWSWDIPCTGLGMSRNEGNPSENPPGNLALAREEAMSKKHRRTGWVNAIGKPSQNLVSGPDGKVKRLLAKTTR